VAIGDRSCVWLLGFGVLLQICAILAFHHSPVEVATVQASVVIVVLIVNELLFHPVLRRDRRISQPTGV
jgi:hypothetical protein